MRLREENYNMVLLATVALLGFAVAGGAVLLGPASPPDRKPPLQLADQTPVRVIGTPFVPNTRPSER